MPIQGYGFLILLVIVVIWSAVKILKEYERAVIFFLGRVHQKAGGPSIVFLIPFLQTMRKVDMRTLVHDVPS